MDRLFHASIALQDDGPGHVVSVGSLVTDRMELRDRVRPYHLPALLTSDEVAVWLRTTRKAVYVLVERGQLPGVVRVGRRVLFRQDAMLDFLRQKSAPSLER